MTDGRLFLLSLALLLTFEKGQRFDGVRALCIDLFCGLGGWAEGFLAEGWEVVGFDIHPQPRYPAIFHLADVRVFARDVEEKHLSGWYGRLKDAALIVASPPCDDFSRWDQPWPNVVKNRKQPDLSLWFAAHRIHEALGVPLIVENVRGAQKFMGPARQHFGKQYLWGDVPALLPGIDGLQNEGRQKQSLSSTRKAERAKIPFPLAHWIAQVYDPRRAETSSLDVRERSEV